MLRAEPTSRSTIVGADSRGTQVTTSNRALNGWWEVTINGTTGWVGTPPPHPQLTRPSLQDGLTKPKTTPCLEPNPPAKHHRRATTPRHPSHHLKPRPQRMVGSHHQRHHRLGQHTATSPNATRPSPQDRLTKPKTTPCSEPNPPTKAPSSSDSPAAPKSPPQTAPSTDGGKSPSTAPPAGSAHRHFTHTLRDHHRRAGLPSQRQHRAPSRTHQKQNLSRATPPRHPSHHLKPRPQRMVEVTINGTTGWVSTPPSPKRYETITAGPGLPSQETTPCSGAEPTSRSTIVERLPRGTQVTTSNRAVNGWWEVTINGTTGWIAHRHFTRE